jgi:exopolyphosphatase/guanosine-5'-triphosphate,3'-diphosphate pyrophosphatase
MIIGSIARYHRKSLPDMKHDHYAALNDEERGIVDILACILRLADGLDSAHQERVRDITCYKVTKKKITLKCASLNHSKEEIQAALDKADLMKKVFHREINIKWEEIS